MSITDLRFMDTETKIQHLKERYRFYDEDDPRYASVEELIALSNFYKKNSSRPPQNLFQVLLQEGEFKVIVNSEEQKSSMLNKYNLKPDCFINIRSAQEVRKHAVGIPAIPEQDLMQTVFTNALNMITDHRDHILSLEGELKRLSDKYNSLKTKQEEYDNILNQADSKDRYEKFDNDTARKIAYRSDKFLKGCYYECIKTIEKTAKAGHFWCIIDLPSFCLPYVMPRLEKRFESVVEMKNKIGFLSRHINDASIRVSWGNKKPTKWQVFLKKLAKVFKR